jgi:hypothetical protein
MKAAARILATAIALAVLSALSLATAAHAAPPQHDPPSGQDERPIQGDRIWVCNSGHGPQFDCVHDAAFGSQPSPGFAASAPAGNGRQLVPVLAVTLLGLLVTLAAGASWLRGHRRPREAI